MSGAPRALLVQPPVYDFALYDLFLHPFGLLRIGRWLAEAGYEIDLLDGLSSGRSGPAARRDAPGRGRIARRRVEAPSVLSDVGRSFARYGMPAHEIRGRIAAARPDIVLVTSGMTYWYPGVAEVARACAEGAPQAPVVIGGVYATLAPDHCATIAPEATVVAGAAGPTLPGVLESLGLPVPADDGSRAAGGPPANPAPSGVPVPARLKDAAVIRLNEGCRGRCAYCASGRLSPRFGRGDPDEVVATVRAWVREGVRTFAFYDDALLDDAQRGIVPTLEAIISAIGERRIEIALPNALHVSMLDARVAGLLRRAGVREVRLGVESLDGEFHRRLDEKLVPGELARALDALDGAGFSAGEVAAYVLAGLPGQEAAEVEATVEGLLARGVQPHVSEYSPVPGSRLFAEACRVSRYPLETEPLCHNNTAFPTAWERFTREDLERIKRRAADGRRRLASGATPLRSGGGLLR